MSKPITEQQYLEAMEMLQFHEKKVEQLKRITRAYMYQWESERIEHRKKQSAIDNYLKLKS